MKDKHLIIAIDGPAGSGKTTVAKALANKLQITYLNTGAMYRALGLKCVFCGFNPDDENAANIIANSTKLSIEYKDGSQRVILDDKDVSDQLSNELIGSYASKISKHKKVREKLVAIQRELAEKQNVVVDGRDIGSVVLPNANFKFYLDADVNVRAQRRLLDLQKTNPAETFENVLEELKERDYNDKTRAVSPLIICPDAKVIDCTNMTIEEVINKFLSIING